MSQLRNAGAPSSRVEPSAVDPALATVRIRSLFLRLIGVVYLTAFWSLGRQIVGLLGERGLRPAHVFLERVGPQLEPGWRGFLELPTLLWWLGASDAMLRTLCTVGMVAASALIAGFAPLAMLVGLWLIYLSLVLVGAPFLSFQWDALLLEAGFLAMLWAPASLRLAAARSAPPSLLVRWLLLWLLFRLMFFSGWVKLASGDPVWWNLTALEFHYWTQPLPTWTSWYANLLPTWLQKLSCAVMFAIELGMPFLIFAGRRARLIAAAGFVLLQAAIAATGNYGFFNLLTVVLCVPLLDDAVLPRWSRLAGSAAPAAPQNRATPIARARRAVEIVAAVLLLVLSVPQAWRQLTGARSPVDGLLEPIAAWTRPLHLVSPYGLFAVMTRTRPEIVIEGSDDGVDWTPYVFRWKPGPLARRPAFVAPDMPRLDWQMWFDALGIERMVGGIRSRYDLVTPDLLRRLGEGEPSVLALLAENPFGPSPPRHLRWQLYRYRFTDVAERHARGDWWKRELVYDGGEGS